MDSIGVEAVGPEKGSVAERLCFSLHPYVQTAVQTEYRHVEKCATRGHRPCSIPHPGAAHRRESGWGFFRPHRAVPGQIYYRGGASKSQTGFPPSTTSTVQSASVFPDS